MTDPRDRAERAFTDAFAAVPEPEPLDPRELRPAEAAPGPGRRPWLPLAAAAAVLVVAGAVGVGVVRGPAPSAPERLPAAAPADAAAGGAGEAAPAGVDPLGCPVVAPDARAAGPAGVLCQYDDPAPGVPSLVGSRVLDADAADRLLLALAAGGPVDPTPCPGGGETLVTVGRVWLRVPTCGPAYVDDGATRRAATADLCSLVFAPPLAPPEGRVCAPE